jgi:uncharacterized protein (DUF433 family)/DNA-binding transcriptional MerR regulator
MATLTRKWELPPEIIGVYTPHRAGALAGVSGQSIGQWARNGLISASVYEGRPANLYSYFDVAEAIVVRWLLDRGVTHPQIAYALSHVRHDFPNWPLLNAPLGIGQQSTDDPGRLVRKTDDREYIDVSGDRPGQVVIRPTLLHGAADMLEHGGWLANALGLRRIEVTPAKLGGQPSLRGRRWTVDHVARLGADDEGQAILREQYGLDQGEIDEALQWAEAAEALAA